MVQVRKEISIIHHLFENNLIGNYLKCTNEAWTRAERFPLERQPAASLQRPEGPALGYIGTYYVEANGYVQFLLGIL
jgi:hypothetical protein